MAEQNGCSIEPVGNRQWNRLWPLMVSGVLFLLISCALQLIPPFPLDDDTAYHAAVGQLIREHGILRSFPWTPFTWMADRYADKELLFHLLFVPFSGFGWVTASRIVGTVCGAALLFTLYLILRAERVNNARLWAIISLTGSVLFFWRFMLVRPHLVSIILSLTILWSATRGRYAVLAIASAVFPWAYVAFWQLPCLLLIAAETAHLLSGQRIRWKLAASVAIGVTIGLVTHPNAANLVSINMMEMVDLLFKHSWGDRTGYDNIGELAPYPLAGWIQGLIFNCVMTVTAMFIAWRNRRKEVLLLSFALAAAGFCILTMKSSRFAEYFAPFSVAAMALASNSIKWRHFPTAILAVSLAWMVWLQPNTFREMSARPDYMPREIASFLQRQLPPGTMVFNTDWELAGWLMLTLPERRFVSALDPTFLYKKDPERYRVWYGLRHGTVPGPAAAIRDRFGARYVLGFNKPASKRLFDQLSAEQGARRLLLSDTWVLFDLGFSPGD